VNTATSTILSDNVLKANTEVDETCSNEKTSENDIHILTTFLNSTDGNYEFSINDDDEEIKNIMNMSIPVASSSKKIDLFDITPSPGIQISPNDNDMSYDDERRDCDTKYMSNLTKKVCDSFTYQSTKGNDKTKIILVIIQIIFTFYYV